MAFVACLLAWPRVPLVVGYHNDVVKPRALIRLYAPVQDTVLRRAEAIMVGTQAYLDTSPFLRPYRAKCCIVPYGIPLQQLAADAAAESQAAQLRARHRGPLVLFVGRLTTVGLFICATTFEIVYVFPLPVTPSSV